MSTTQIVLLLVILVALQAAIWVAVFLRLKRQRVVLEEELSRTGETVLIAPQRGFYAGGTPPYSMVKSLGTIALTQRRVIFQKLLGPPIEIPVARIAEVSEGTWFRGHYRGGRAFLILRLDDGSQVGFQVRQHHRWRSELSTLMAGDR